WGMLYGGKPLASATSGAPQIPGNEYLAPPAAWPLLELLAAALSLQERIRAGGPDGRPYSDPLFGGSGNGMGFPHLPPDGVRTALPVLVWAMTLAPERPEIHGDLARLYDYLGKDKAIRRRDSVRPHCDGAASAHEWIRKRCEAAARDCATSPRKRTESLR